MNLGALLASPFLSTFKEGTQMKLSEVINVLKKDDLFKEVVINNKWTYDLPANADVDLTNLEYDSRQIKDGGLFVAKGNFKVDYIHSAIANGASAVITPLVFDKELTTAEHQTPQVIVTDVQKALAVVSRAYYGYPDRALKIAGVTGTKGKTTTVYFTRHILHSALNVPIAQFSSIDNCVDGHTMFESELTTPESLDLYRMMRQAVDNGIKYLVMEVSSQSYKKSRVYGLHFDVGAFLNISPDHISPVEHPTFDDYLFCKSQLIKNADVMVINQANKYYQLLVEKAQAFDTPVVSFGNAQSTADYRYTAGTHGHFSVASENQSLPDLSGDYRVMIPGDFNYENALAAMIISSRFGAKKEDMLDGLKNTTVPGRMEMLHSKSGLLACVDYAHDYASLTASFSFVRHEYPNGRLIVVIGSAGGKAESRRADIGHVLSKYADVAILTSEDNFKEDPHKIDGDIKANITNPHLDVTINVDRVAAIKQAFKIAKPGDVMFMAAKGRETFMHQGGTDIPYVGDYQLTKKLMAADDDKYAHQK